MWHVTVVTLLDYSESVENNINSAVVTFLALLGGLKCIATSQSEFFLLYMGV